MTRATVSQGNVSGLPPALKLAQEAIHFPAVQEMLRKLSGYGLGIFMPHKHDEQTGEFQPLPEQFIQVESSLEVSFRPLEQIASQTDSFLPVGWMWRAGSATPSAVCEMVRDQTPGNVDPSVKHKMDPRT
jgi:hypothetical protein